MSLCRYLPTPSDRMAIIWSLLTVEGSIILEYGPAGTTHFSMGFYGGLGIDFQQRLFTTHMSEDDVVMGDVTRLEEAIAELDSSYNPKVIFVLASSTSSVIGTDIKGVCTYMQAEVKARLIAFEQGGLRGDYSTGVQEAYKLLVKNLVQPAEAKQDGTYNIIGASMGRYRMASDVWELQNLMREAYGMQLHTCMCDATSVEAIAAMGSAQLNIVISCEGLAAAKMLEEKCGTPYIYCAPYGYQGTIDFITAVGKAMGKMPPMSMIGRLKGKLRGMSMLGMFAMMGGGSVKPAAIVKGDYDQVLGVAEFLKQAGIDVQHMVCSHSLKNIAEPAAGIEHYADEKDWLAIFKQSHKALVLADDIALLQCDDSNTKLRISSPFLTGSHIATHLPFMGEKGADALLETVELYYQSFY